MNRSAEGVDIVELASGGGDGGCDKSRLLRLGWRDEVTVPDVGMGLPFVWLELLDLSFSLLHPASAL